MNETSELLNKIDSLEKELEEMKIQLDKSRNCRENLSQAMRMLPIVICELAPTTRILEVSEGGLELFGYSQTHLEKGLYGMDLFSNEDKPIIGQQIEDIKNGRQFTPQEYRIKRGDGSWANVVISSKAHFKNGTFSGFRIILVDVSDLEMYKRKIESTNMSFRHFADLIPQTVFETDQNGYFTFCNEAAERTFEYALDDLRKGVHVLDVIAPEEQEKAASNIKRIEMGMEASEHDYIAIKKSGVRFPVTVYSSLIVENGQIKGIRGILLDMSSRFEAKNNELKVEAQLFDVQKMDAVARVAKGVAHDFFNILTIIISGIELIQEKISSNRRLFEELEDIKQSAHRGSSLISKLMAFSTKQIISPRSVNLNELIHKSSDLLRSLCGENINLKIELDEKIKDIFIDELQLEQIITNLVINAREAITDSGTIAVSTGMALVEEHEIPIHLPHDRNEFALLQITDTGTGIEPDILNSVFEPFFTTKTNSSGLGLSTVFGIARQNNGFIRIDSTQGIGTTVRVYFQTAVQVSTPLPSTKELMLINSKAFKIFVVEDESMVLGAVTRILRRKGFTVFPFQDPEDALNVFHDIGNEIDLLLTDVIMPRIDGKILSDELLAINPQLQVIYMSGHNNIIVSEKGILLEGANFIQKPFTMNQLIHKVKSVLYNRS
ncbi:PAS domain S-box protein [Myxococcota bacterium]|nr:PAS domain S-box protein [Myxococcota bacterium]MBU1379209.1 PAS domain S-box protein [Myxococcota bacterium]MBU1496220.1 PAS domain S-box protein [Myxococcota bacterium]